MLCGSGHLGFIISDCTNIIQVQCSLGLIKFVVSENYVKQCPASAAIIKHSCCFFPLGPVVSEDLIDEAEDDSCKVMTVTHLAHGIYSKPVSLILHS